MLPKSVNKKASKKVVKTKKRQQNDEEWELPSSLKDNFEVSTSEVGKKLELTAVSFILVNLISSYF